MKTRNYSDWVVALAVIACSAILFAALAFALSGTFLGKPSRMVKANFRDVTGITKGCQVKYAGALAGVVTDIRMLSLKERTASGDPLNAVQITVGLEKNVPELPADITISLAADTLLSDKFILLTGGSPTAPPLAPDTILQGITPITFDKLARDIDGTIEGLQGLLNGKEGTTDDLFKNVRTVLDQLQSVLTEAKPALADVRSLVTDAKSVVGDAKSLTINANGLITDAQGLITSNKEGITRTIAHLDEATTKLDALAKKTTDLIASNEKNLTSSLADLKVTSQNLKVTSTYTKIFTKSLNLKPSQLLWGNPKPPLLPSEEAIIRALKPIPAN